jgi:hypothetical protein
MQANLQSPEVGTIDAVQITFTNDLRPDSGWATNTGWTEPPVLEMEP